MDHDLVQENPDSAAAYTLPNLFEGHEVCE